MMTENSDDMIFEFSLCDMKMLDDQAKKETCLILQ